MVSICANIVPSNFLWVCFTVTGTLKGYDQLLNLVLDEVVEFIRDSDDPLKTTDQTRRLGLIVCILCSSLVALYLRAIEINPTDRLTWGIN